MKANTIVQFTYRNANVDKVPRVLVLYAETDRIYGINLNYIGYDYSKILKSFEATEFDDAKELYETRIKNSPMSKAYRVYLTEAIINPKTIKDPAVEKKTSFFDKFKQVIVGARK